MYRDGERNRELLGVPGRTRRERLQHGERFANHNHARIGQPDSGRSEIRSALNGKAGLRGYETADAGGQARLEPSAEEN